MMNSYTVLTDLSVFRKELAEHCPNFDMVCRPNLWRPILDIIFDWLLIVAATYAGYRLGILAYPFVIFIIANRQRALGNLLHEAAHENLYSNKVVNDLTAILLLAPAVMTDLEAYRDLYFKHHAKLGKIKEDPDYISASSPGKMSWCTTYFHELFSLKNWMSSIFGHAIKKEINWLRRIYFGLWWAVIIGLFISCFDGSFALYFVITWFVARATIFHMMTIFREMCDHFGLKSGGIYSFTRDIVTGCLCCWVIHPRNNAYHLTHHLMPSIPYYQLRAAQKIFCHLPSYKLRGIVCRSYLFGSSAVVRCRFKNKKSKIL